MGEQAVFVFVIVFEPEIDPCPPPCVTGGFLEHTHVCGPLNMFFIGPLNMYMSPRKAKNGQSLASGGLKSRK